MNNGFGMAVDHGGGIDAACSLWGGTRSDWLDLSTGINPEVYSIQGLAASDWNFLPDHRAQVDVTEAARQFWQIPDSAAVTAVNGLSAAIAILPYILQSGPSANTVRIPSATYNEYERAFRSAGWESGDSVRVIVHPNNPDGSLCHDANSPYAVRIIDESFCDTMPQESLMRLASEPGVIILKSFGKFWGLAGIRLGFVIGDPVLVGRLERALGPWPVSGPALKIGAMALRDHGWAERTRARLQRDAARLDQVFTGWGAKCIGGTPLFRLYHVDVAQDWHDDLARKHILTRIFPYAPTWLRVGLPPSGAWGRLEQAK